MSETTILLQAFIKNLLTNNEVAYINGYTIEGGRQSGDMLIVDLGEHTKAFPINAEIHQHDNGSFQVADADGDNGILNVYHPEDLLVNEILHLHS